MILKKLKILHLESIAYDAGLVDRQLHKGNINFEKLLVDNKNDFENALHSFSPDIILSDHTLPGFSSAEALAIVQQKAPQVPFILVTENVLVEFAVDILTQGAKDYILKSDIQRLPAAVLAATEKAESISKKEKIQSELLQSCQQLRDLVSHLQETREEEKAAMAKEVHSELGQQLTALKLGISWLGLKLKDADAEMVNKVKTMEELINISQKTVKKIITELHPEILDRLGLINAIRWQNGEIGKDTNLEIDLTVPAGEIKTDSKVTIALFRIYQDALLNIIKHAKADTVTVTIQQQGNGIKMLIADDGTGFETDMLPAQSLGLFSMKERAAVLGGTFEIRSKPGEGTTVSVVIPTEGSR